MFTGIIKPTSGELEILGLKIPQDADKLNELIGYVPQNLVFYDHLTINEIDCCPKNENYPCNR